MKIIQSNTFFKSKKLNMVIDKFRDGKHKLVGTLNGKYMCTFLIVDYSCKLEETLKAIKENRKMLISNLDNLSSSLDWCEHTYIEEKSKIIITGNFVNTQENVNKFLTPFLNVIKNL